MVGRPLPLSTFTAGFVTEREVCQPARSILVSLRRGDLTYAPTSAYCLTDASLERDTLLKR
jgi:hypothetical protein